MNRTAYNALWGRESINRLAQHVEHSAKRRAPYRDFYRAPGVDDGHAASQSGRTAHRDCPHCSWVDVFLYLDDEMGLAIAMNDKSVVDAREIARSKFGVHHYTRYARYSTSARQTSAPCEALKCGYYTMGSLNVAVTFALGKRRNTTSPCCFSGRGFWDTLGAPGR